MLFNVTKRVEDTVIQDSTYDIKQDIETIIADEVQRVEDELYELSKLKPNLELSIAIAFYNLYQLLNKKEGKLSKKVGKSYEYHFNFDVDKQICEIRTVDHIHSLEIVKTVMI